MNTLRPVRHTIGCTYLYTQNGGIVIPKEQENTDGQNN
jgi:hypothetical protein